MHLPFPSILSAAVQAPSELQAAIALSVKAFHTTLNEVQQLSSSALPAATTNNPNSHNGNISSGPNKQLNSRFSSQLVNVAAAAISSADYTTNGNNSLSGRAQAADSHPNPAASSALPAYTASSAPMESLKVVPLADDGSSFTLNALDFFRLCTFRVTAALALGIPVDYLSHQEALTIVRKVNAYFKVCDVLLSAAV